ncbi:MAG: ATP-binding protein [Janthinobacterium lividum]
MQTRNSNLTVAIILVLASVIYSAILLKTNLDVVKNSKSSITLQQINAQELSTALGNLQLNINRYIIIRKQTSLDSINLYKRSYQSQANVLYHITQDIPSLKKTGQILKFVFPIIMEQTENKLRALPSKITITNAADVFNKNSDPFSVLWKNIDSVRSYQIKLIKTNTQQTITAGDISWKVSILGSIFMFFVILASYLYIRKSYKKQKNAEEKELVSEVKHKENEKLMQAVIDNCNATIYIKDKDSRFTLVNKAFRTTFKLKNKDIIDKTHNEVFGKTYPQYISTNEERILNLGESEEISKCIVFPDQKRYYLTNKFPLYNTGGEIFGLGAVSTDITEQKARQDELTQARELAEAAKISQQRFLANMSHEIRTPMNGVIGMTNLLDSTPLNPEQADYVKVIRQSSNILMLLINDILDVSKMQAGMLQLEKIPFEVRESIKQIFLSYKPLADEMGTTLNCEIDAATPEFLLGDPLRLNQIISNLVNNAIKFTSAGSVNIKVSANQKEADVFALKVDVIDTGIGIPADKLTDIFKSFTQSSTSTTRKYGGTGLGLAIVKELVEMQNGTVHLVSELHVGSTFTIIIPFPLAEVDKTQQQKSKGAQKFASLKNKRILVVEDNLINQKVARQILLKAGFETVDIADNGLKALDILRIESYDAILMDVQMPEMDGMETTRHIRNELKLSLPIIALTASALPEDREVCFNAGMNEYVTKPFLPEDLLQKLSMLLQ